MSDSIAVQLSDRMRQIDEQLLSVVQQTTEEQLTWSDRPTAPSIAFHLWHIARWADRNQAFLASVTDSSADSQEIWHSKNLASIWGLDSSVLGSGETGLGMSDEDAANFSLPSKSELMEYAGQSLGLLDSQYASVTDEMLAAQAADASGRQTTVAAAMLSHLTHASRHLGMIEALRGIQGQRGTASA